MKFNKLNVPSYWRNYWTRYPEGHTILEALIQWVSQVDEMVDNQNTLNDNVTQFRNEIDAFVGRFDERLQDEITKTLKDWQTSGFLDVVISEALQWQLDDYITTNEQDKLSISTQLAQKATKGEIGISDLDKNKTKFDETWMTDEFKQQIVGDTPIHSEVSDFGITTRKLAEKAVTPIKTSFIVRSSNLFDMNRLVAGQLVDGEYEPAETWFYTPEYEPISPNTPYILLTGSGQARVWLYDKNYEAITMYEANGTNQSIDISGGASFAFVRFSAHRLTPMETVQFNEGTVPLPYEHYYLRLSDEILLPGMVQEGTELRGD